jgi:hypothetical protein
MTVMLVSGLKKAVNPESPITLQVWAFHLSFGKDGEVEPGLNLAFLVTQALTMAYNARGFDDAASERVRNAWSWESISTSVAKGEGDLGDILGIVETGYGAPSGDTIYGIANRLLSSVVHYGVQQALTAAGWDENAFDLINLGIDKGLGAGMKEAMEAIREPAKDTMLEHFSNM